MINAGPPEDCGGIHGYYNYLEILADPKHEEHKSIKNWMGGTWDAALFDIETASAALKHLEA